MIFTDTRDERLATQYSNTRRQGQMGVELNNTRQ